MSDAATRKPFFCVTCGAQFTDAAAHRAHYKSDWHRYNLRRKVAGLGPMLEAVFIAKRDAALRAKQATQGKPYFAKCIPCNKTFSSYNAHMQHMASKKHKLRFDKWTAANAILAAKGKAKAAAEAKAAATQAADESPVAAADEAKVAAPGAAAPDSTEAAQAAPVTDEAKASESESSDDSTMTSESQPAGYKCPFSNKVFKTHQALLRYMRREHSFILPDPEYLTDLEGLLRYMTVKIQEYHTCLYCQKQFASAQACQKHMIDKGHCRILFDERRDAAEYEAFYDFTTSYPTDMQRRKVMGEGTRGAAATAEVKDGDDDAAAAAAAAGDEEAELSDAELRRGVELLPSGELLMSDGRIVGHRMYRRYYRQAVLPETDSDAVRASRAMLTDRGTEGAGARGASALTVRAWRTPMSRDVAAKHRNAFVAARAKKNMEVSVRANKLQKHFRAQVNF